MPVMDVAVGTFLYNVGDFLSFLADAPADELHRQSDTDGEQEAF